MKGRRKGRREKEAMVFGNATGSVVLFISVLFFSALILFVSCFLLIGVLVCRLVGQSTPICGGQREKKKRRVQRRGEKGGDKEKEHVES